MMTDKNETPLKKTPLHEEHIALGARMVNFAGYDMPVQYPTGIITEHLHTREKAGLFDVSHMGQAWLKGDNHEVVSQALESLVGADVMGLDHGQQRYTQLLNDDGGIIDDLMVSRPLHPDLEGWLYLVVNAARKDIDYDHIRNNLPENVTLETIDDYALMALQGPKAAAVLKKLGVGAHELNFMRRGSFTLDHMDMHISRSGYTGEDGFEISIHKDHARDLWQRLCSCDDVLPIGLGARDSLRLEAGLCLYGHDIDENTSPVEAAIQWSLGKERRTNGTLKGAERIQREITEGVNRKRVGFVLEGRAPAREGAEIIKDGAVIGHITSGGYAPCMQSAIAMGYVQPDYANIGTELELMVRGKALAATVAKMPFVKNGYKR